MPGLLPEAFLSRSRLIRLTHVITGLNQGGAEAALVRLLRGLESEGFRQSVISLTGRGLYGDLIEAAGIPLRTLGMRSTVRMVLGLPNLFGALRGLEPDIVQTWLYHADLLGLVAARLAGDAAVSWNVRCAGLAPGDVPHSTHWLIRLLAWLSPQPEAILFNSVAGRRSHEAIGYRPRTGLTIPNGFDLEVWRPDPSQRMDFRAEIGVDGSAFVVGMVARYHRMKDHKTFLAAAALLRKRVPGVRFVLAGPGILWDNGVLAADIDRLGLRDAVVLLGPRRDMARIMAGIDCLVSTSTSEGFPNVLGEAMACGVPCVATDVGDSRLIVGDTGSLVAVGDAEAIATAVAELATVGPETKTAQAIRCRQRIADNFGLDSVVGRYAAFYRQLDAKENQVGREA